MKRDSAAMAGPERLAKVSEGAEQKCQRLTPDALRSLGSAVSDSDKVRVLRERISDEETLDLGALLLSQESESEPHVQQQHGLQPPEIDGSDPNNTPLLAWVPRLLTFFEPLFHDKVWLNPLMLSTSCSGTGAPRLGLKAMGVPLTETASADPKTACMQLARSLGQLPEHHFNTAAGLAAKHGFCCIHEAVCQLPCQQDHLFVAGFPCAPFSSQRPERFKSHTSQWQSHPDTYVMFDVAKDIRSREPCLCVLEPGFLMQARSDLAEPRSAWEPKHAKGSPLDTLLATINDGYSPEAPRYFWHVALIDSCLWLEGARERMYMLLVHHSLGEGVLQGALCRQPWRSAGKVRKFLLASCSCPATQCTWLRSLLNWRQGNW